MAVYERTYKRWQGTTTPQALRFLVLPRYVFRDVFKSRILVFFYAICFIPPVFIGAAIYLRNNLSLFEDAGMISPELLERFAIDARLFETLLTIQGILALVLTIFIGPSLVSRDLANNGLPLYLSRPISRAEYVTGKISVLFILLSAITWLPGIGLFSLQSSLADGWMTEHLRIVPALCLGSVAWILLLAFVALALSAWVKWRPVAAFGIFMIFIGGTFFAAILNLLFFRHGEQWGHMVNPLWLSKIILAGLFGNSSPEGPPLVAAWLGLLAIAGFFLYLLHRKLRAYEVVS